MIKQITLVLFSFLLLGCPSNSTKNNSYISRCEEITGINDLNGLLNDVKKYHFQKGGNEYYTLYSSPHQIDKIKELLDRQGFSNWKKGGITYGPIDVGGVPSDNVVYSIIKEANGSRLVAINYDRNEVHVIMTYKWGRPR